MFCSIKLYKYAGCGSHITWPYLIKVTQKWHVRGQHVKAGTFSGSLTGMASKDVNRNVVPTEMIRNIGIIAHIDAGKTTTTERMLYYAGLTRHLGDVDDGDTVMDFMEQERNRGITITSAAITFMWNKHRFNLIDTPGHVDFTLEVERSLRVLDGAVTVLDASAGVEAQTLTVWRQADRYQVPRIVFCNKMDKQRADFDFSVQSISEKFHIVPLVIQIPIGAGQSYSGMVDLINMDKMEWQDSKGDGQNYSKSAVEKTQDESLYEEAYDMRQRLVEQLADVNDTIAEYVLNDRSHLDIPKLVIHNAVRQATLDRKCVPVLCGSSLKNKGVQPLLDSVIKYLPNPTERHHKFTEYYQNELCGLAFKFVHDKQRGRLTFVRLFSGEIKSGSNIYNVNREYTEKVGRLFQVYADEHKEISSATAGNIVAVSGLKETITGDTFTTNLSAANSAKKAATKKAPKITQDSEQTEIESSSPVLAGLVIPDPVFFCSIEIESLAYQKQLDEALACLTKEDPSIKVHIDADTGQTVLSGMGELHLEITQSRIKQEYGVEVDLGPLQIAYRETLTSSSKKENVIDKLIGKARHKVSMCLSVQALEYSSSFSHVDIEPDKGCEMDPKRLKRPVLQAINNGVKSALSRGPLMGFPVMDVQVKLHDLKVRYGTSLPMITGCAAQATFQALQEAGSVLLEPMMSLEVYTDDACLSALLSDLSQRRSQIQEIQARGQDNRTIIALSPLANMVGYATALRTLSSGTASFAMELSHYERMSDMDQRTAIKKVTGFAPL